MHGLALFLALYTHAEINRLGHPSWVQREQASAALRNQLPMSLPAIRAARELHADAEVINRCRRLEIDWINRQEKFAEWNWNRCLDRARALRSPGYRFIPYIDQLPSDWPDRSDIIAKYRKVAGWRLCQADCPTIENWHGDRTAMMYYAVDLLVVGYTEDQIVTMYRQAAVIEKAWLKKAGHLRILHEAVEE